MARRKFWIYYNSSNLTEDFCIDEFGLHASDPEYSFTEKRINHIFHFVVKGTCHLTMGENEHAEQYTVREGQSFFVRAGTPHTYTADKTEGCTRYWLSFSGHKAEEILRCCKIQDGQIIIDGIDFMLLAKRYNALYKCISTDENNEFVVLSNVADILDIVAKARAKQVKKKEGEISDKQLLAKAVMEYVKGNLAERLNVKDIAYKFGYERSYLYRLFLEENGFSIQQYIIMCRINHARYLLVETNKPIHEIAHEVGYESYAAFSKIFIREAGSTPSDYRKKNSYKHVKT